MPKPLLGSKLQIGENAYPTANRVLARNATEAMLPTFRDRHLGRLFQLDGAIYRIESIHLDGLKRIIGVGNRTAK